MVLLFIAAGSVSSLAACSSPPAHQGSPSDGSPSVPSVTLGRVACAPKPSACGYPDSTTAGVPAGTTLRSVPSQVSSGNGWHWDSRGWVTVDGDGAVLDGLSVLTNVEVTANNVTIKNSRIVNTGEGWGVGLRHAAGTVIRNNEIYSPYAGSGRLMVAIKDIYGDSTSTQVLGNDIYHTSTGVQIESGLIQDNYIHDMGYVSGDHLNGTTSNGGTTQLTLRHNTIFNSQAQTDAISLFQDFGAQSNRLIDNNLLAGGGYTIYAGANPGMSATATNITVTNNRISRMYYPNGGYYGPVTAYTSGNGNTWSGNVWDEPAQGTVNP